MRALVGAARPSLPRLRARLPSSFCALRVPACAGAPAPARGRSGAARPPPLRCPGPAPSALPRFARSPGPPPGPAPRLSRSACVRACALLGARWPRCAWGRPSFGCGLPLVALALCVRPSALRVAPPGPPGPSPSGLRGRSAPAPGPVRPFGPLFPALAPGLFCARPARRAALSIVGVRCVFPSALVSVASPLPPSRPCAPRWGAAGSAWLCHWGPRPPALWASPGERPGAHHCAPGRGASRRATGGT